TPPVAKITKIDGRVQVRLKPDETWQWAKEGMELPDSAELRTGLRDQVELLLLPDVPYTVKRLKAVKLSDVISEAKPQKRSSLDVNATPSGLEIAIGPATQGRPAEPGQPWAIFRDPFGVK